MIPPLLSLENVCLKTGNEIIIFKLSFTIQAGEIACLLGPSGCGKTTTLRAIAGFEPLKTGQIKLENTVIADTIHSLPTEKRRIGMVFQDHALFPHLNVRENIEFGLHTLTKTERNKVVTRYLKMVGLEDLAERLVHNISGGQQQRIALARALAPHPKLLLLDEPFSNLDVNLRKKLRTELVQVLKKEKLSALLVTHDQEEAFSMADKIGVLAHGNLQQWDTPYNLYHKPSNRYVASFIGLGSFIHGSVTSPNSIRTQLGDLESAESLSWKTGTNVEVLLRPDDILPNPKSSLRASVAEKKFNGASTLYTLILNANEQVEALFSSHYDYEINSNIGIEVKADHVVAFSNT